MAPKMSREKYISLLRNGGLALDGVCRSIKTVDIQMTYYRQRGTRCWFTRFPIQLTSLNKMRYEGFLNNSYIPILIRAGDTAKET
jgi:hypothetical protein